LLHFKTKFETARNNFETKTIKSLLEKVVSGYSAEKDIVDPVWNQYCSIETNNINSAQSVSEQQITPADDKKLH
jgi:hypothetical protein